MFELLTGMPPFYDNDKSVLFNNIKNTPLKIPKNISEPAQDLMRSLMIKNPL